MWQKFRVRVVCAEHHEQVALHHRVVGSLRADHADSANPTRIIVRHDVLALDGVNKWRLESIGQRAQLAGGTAAARAAHDDDASCRVDSLRRVGYRLFSRDHFRQRLQGRDARDSRLRPGFKDVLRNRQVRDPAPRIRSTDCLMYYSRGLRRS